MAGLPSRCPFILNTWLRSPLVLSLLAVCLLSGCIHVPVAVSNPIPGMTTVAIAPFFNLSSEPSADGRRVAEAYYAELQKQGGYQVIPVGVVEAAMRQNQLTLSDPADTIRLAELLGADAVVVGAITAYQPYYPPQIGLQVQWYSPREWTFYPGVQPYTSKEVVSRETDAQGVTLAKLRPQPGTATTAVAMQQATGPRNNGLVIRGQSGSELSDDQLDDLIDQLDAMDTDIELVQARGGANAGKKEAENRFWPTRNRGTPPLGRSPSGSSSGAGSALQSATNGLFSGRNAASSGKNRAARTGSSAAQMIAANNGPPQGNEQSNSNGGPSSNPGTMSTSQPGNEGGPAVSGNLSAAGDPNAAVDPSAAAAACPPRPIEPIMSYTRFFDGADPELVKLLKAYRHYRGDMRSGGWEAYLHRSEDFLHFTSHVMIVEMLNLHGGTLRTEMVLRTWK